ncbi:ABC transporter ATP-binding protein [Aeromonas veronii]|uniref:ABC transporter ATP-binding protein n=1 Tax=Aeromonas veronii TaxID=654 RepID=A0ABY3MHP6_AERVE|nr:ABC transporter ATP-binding protein [Aeromonas veronii]RDU78136.1 ABC transporter ATP-binding protein [Aeromonas veronii]RDU80486.1 ABC transporter ATP-binding protein [Aeromonas veronii]RDU80990.1 ABC transporter ATP-binding protein [Aeromonas veronii]RDU89743.1 ABC transporter ATP-binding protein [Aeromonas veronii]TEY46270.1 ABC transporter ATP-binding protein [Aeromonas veronii]
MLTLRNLCKSFDNGSERLPLFHHLDLALPAGEITLLLGQSGCGKSTLLNLIAGLIAPDEGEIWLGETRIDTRSPDERARLRGRHFGIVYQDFNLLPTLNVVENLALPLAINALPPDETKIDQLLHRLDMSHKRHAWPEQLSGGQRQRVALARALIHQPDWLLADEPTGSLDEHNAEQVMALMVAAVRDTGAGLLLVSHNPAYAELADRVLRLEGGQLIELKGPRHD